LYQKLIYMIKKNILDMQVDELKNIISQTVREEILKINSPDSKFEQEEFLTRNETARILSITLVTLHDWTKKGIIPGYRIATRIRYKKTEIIEALQKIRSLKYQRS